MKITAEALREKLYEMDVELRNEELDAVVKAIDDLNHENNEDGLLTLISFRWKNEKGKCVKVSIPW